MTSSPAKPLRVLILGGTADANRLVAAVARRSAPRSVLSYAGRTENPKPPPIAWRVGGFGGVDGLVDYLRTENIARVIDATHPFAAQMSAHAIAACAAAAVPLLALERAPWQRVPGDRWIEVDDFAAAAQALGRYAAPGIPRHRPQHLAPFAAIRSIFIWCGWSIRRVRRCRSTAEVIIARGPFDLAGDRAC